MFMFPDIPTAACHINHITAAGPGFTRRVKVTPGRDGTVETAVIPGQKLISHTPFAPVKPPHEKSGLMGARMHLVRTTVSNTRYQLGSRSNQGSLGPSCVLIAIARVPIEYSTEPHG